MDDTKYAIAEEWLRFADDQENYERQGRKGRARSNSLDISAFLESTNSPILSSAEAALYSRTKEILSHVVRIPMLPECQKNYSRNEISIKGDEVSFLKSEEYQQFCNDRRPTFRITFIGAEDTRRSELLQAISDKYLTSESVCPNAKTDYYLMIANEKTLTFNLILCDVHSGCCIPIKKVMIRTCQLLVCVVDITRPNCDQLLNELLTRIQSECNGKQVCVIGVTRKMDRYPSESVIRSRLQSSVPFTYYEACVDSRKKMKRVTEGISHAVIQSQFNMSDIDSANCTIV